MKTKFVIILIYSLLTVNCHSQPIEEKPPLAKVENVEDVYFGKKVVDPYRYMEDLKDPEVQKWLKAQSDYSRKILDNIPVRQQLIDKMLEFDKRKSERIYRLRITENDHYFYLKRTPIDETGKLFHRVGYEGKEKLLFDPEKYDNDTTKKYVINSLSPSIKGENIAFEIAPDGSESSILLIMNVQEKKLFSEQIDKCWFSSPSWLEDGSSFLYNRLQSDDVHDMNREKDSKTYLHKIGTDPTLDKEIFSREKYSELEINPEDFPMVGYDKDAKLLFGVPYTVDSRLIVYYAPVSELKNNRINWKKLFSKSDEVYNFGMTGKDLYFYTPKNAPNFQLFKIPISDLDIKKSQLVIGENPTGILKSYTINKDALYYTISENGIEEKLYRLSNDEKIATEIKLPFKAGRISLSQKGVEFDDVWVGLMGWSSDYQRYKYLPSENKFKLENLSSVAEYPEYEDLVVEELMIASHDGVKVPLSIIYKNGMIKNKNNPVLFLGYGAYGSSIYPFFSPQYLQWTEHGGIFAVAHVRGGGELGDKWRKAGFKTTKPNTWKDLVSCAEYMINENYTINKKIAIWSASAGGILVGRAMTERPDLFAAVIPEVGCMNTLRGEESPNGPVNAPEFGTVKDSTECMALLEMDSFHHLEEGKKYPATLVTAGMNDPRVIAWQPAKFAARLQAANASNNPILFWADYKAGHGIGNTKTKQIESMADILSFALWQTDK